MPTEKELIDFAVEEEFLLFCDEEEFLQIAEAVLQRFAPARLETAQPQARVAELEGALAAESARLDWLNKHRDGFFNLDRVTSIVGKGFASSNPSTWHADVRGAIDEARNA